jgi:rod shape-determining protein MreB
MAGFSSWLPAQRKVAIDLGTAYIRVAARDLGLVTIPLGHFPRPPLRDGVVADPYEVALILRPLLARARRLGVCPGVAVGIPTDANFRERKALHVAMCAAGAEQVEIIPEPQAAAVGAGLEVGSSYAHMVVDIGEGVTDCAIIRGGGILHSSTIRIGCGTLREQIQAGYRQRWGIDLSPGEAERLLEEAGVGGAAGSSDGSQRAAAGGSAAAAGAVSPSTIHAFVDPGVAGILETVNGQLREIPHAVGCEIIETGIVLTGGGALLPGMRERLSRATSISVSIPRDPLDSVIKGLTRMLEIGAVR